VHVDSVVEQETGMSKEEKQRMKGGDKTKLKGEEDRRKISL
jgi:hypothetical protein